MTDEELVLRERLDLVGRAYRLRKARKIGIVWVNCFAVYLSDSEVDPWGYRERVSWERFRTLIEEAEEQAGWTPRRKPVASEREGYEVPIWRQSAG